MIDTITIRLSQNEFKILDHSKFNPDCYNFFYPPYPKMGSRRYIDAYQNPRKTELKQGIYKPQLTLRLRTQGSEDSVYLYIQFSAPKVLYKNNFDELVDSDIEAILTKLTDSLKNMGVMLRMRDLKEAKVIKIHYSKNIILPEYIIPSMVIGEIKKVDFNLHKELTERDYRNAGHSIRFHTNNYELILYDKKKDLQKSMHSDKRAIENGNSIQLNLFDEIKKKKHFEVIRIESRLNNASWIKKELGISKQNQNIKTLFSSTLSSKVINKSWGRLLNQYSYLKCKTDDKEKFLATFMINNPEVRLTNVLSIYAFLDIANSMGIGKFRNLIQHKYSNKTWYSFKKTIEKYNLKSNLPNHFESISKILQDFEPVRLKDFTEAIDL